METSDFIVDGLNDCWRYNKRRYPNITMLQMDLDNGPEIESHRTQFIKRMVKFSDKIKLPSIVNLPPGVSHFPPHHSPTANRVASISRNTNVPTRRGVVNHSIPSRKVSVTISRLSKNVAYSPRVPIATTRRPTPPVAQQRPPSGFDATRDAIPCQSHDVPNPNTPNATTPDSHDATHEKIQHVRHLRCRQFQRFDDPLESVTKATSHPAAGSRRSRLRPIKLFPMTRRQNPLKK